MSGGELPSFPRFRLVDFGDEFPNRFRLAHYPRSGCRDGIGLCFSGAGCFFGFIEPVFPTLTTRP